MTSTLLQQNPKYLPSVEKYPKKAKLLATNQGSKHDAAHLLYLEGRITQKQGNISKAAMLFRQFLKINTASNNPAHKVLRDT